MSQEARENRIRSLEQWSGNGENDVSASGRCFIKCHFAEPLSDGDRGVDATVPGGGAVASHPSIITDPISQAIPEHRPSVGRHSSSANNPHPNIPPETNTATTSFLDRVSERSEQKQHSFTPTREQVALSNDAIGAKTARILHLQWPDLDLVEINSCVRRSVRLEDMGPIDGQSILVGSDHSSALGQRTDWLQTSLQESGVSAQSRSDMQLLGEIESEWGEGSLLLHSFPYINWLGYVSSFYF